MYYKSDKYNILFIICGVLIGIVGTYLVLVSFNFLKCDCDNNEDCNRFKVNSDDLLTYSFAKLGNNEDNIIYSPLSIKYALSMVNLGADGQTKVEIDKVLGTDDLTTYNNIDKTLSLANAIFIKDGYQNLVSQDFINDNVNKYKSEILYDNFSNVGDVNNWISDKTFKLIENILNDGDLTPETRMVLVNALAIDMDWEEPFENENTFGKTFYLSTGEEYEATTLFKNSTNDVTSYYIDNKITALAMDFKKYGDTQLEFLAIMPNDDLADYIDSVTILDIDNISEQLIKASETEAGVNVSIPKFKFDYQLDLQNDLIALGIEEAFDPDKADFSKIMEEPPLYISKVLHKATIELSEEGAKAAATTVIIMAENAVAIPEEQGEPIEININKPFMFIIRDKNTKEEWFVGNVYQPNSWEEDASKYYGND